MGYANAIDLGDPTSPFGNVHFQNKQTIAKRIVSAAMEIAFGLTGGSGGGEPDDAFCSFNVFDRHLT